MTQMGIVLLGYSSGRKAVMCRVQTAKLKSKMRNVTLIGSAAAETKQPSVVYGDGAAFIAPPSTGSLLVSLCETE